MPDDLAAKLGCREVFEDELESRLKVAEEMIRSERSAGVFAFLLSQRENGLAKLFLSKLSSCDVAMLSRVSKACREGVREAVCELPARLAVRDFVKSTELLKWAKENGCPWDYHAHAPDARGEHSEMLKKWVAENGYPWNKHSCTSAAAAGQLERLQSARDHGCPWDEETCAAAAKGGHLEVLKWALGNGCSLDPWDTHICAVAAFAGHLEVLKWTLENGGLWDKRTCAAAARGGQLGVLKWLREKRHPWDERTCAAAAEGGHLEVLKWLRQNQWPWDERTCAAAAFAGHLEVLKWLRQNQCPWDERTCAAAAFAGHLEVLKWARENGCPPEQVEQVSIPHSPYVKDVPGWELADDDGNLLVGNYDMFRAIHLDLALAKWGVVTGRLVTRDRSAQCEICFGYMDADDHTQCRCCRSPIDPDPDPAYATTRRPQSVASHASSSKEVTDLMRQSREGGRDEDEEDIMLMEFEDYRLLLHSCCEQVMAFFNGPLGADDNGAPIDQVNATLNGSFTKAQVREAVEYLINEGDLYYTINDRYCRSTFL